MNQLNFLNEVVAHSKEKVNLVLLNQKQIEGSVDFLLEKILSENKTNIILISFLHSNQTILNKFNSSKLFIVDCSERGEKNEKAIIVDEINNLTRIQISIEKALEKMGDDTLIIFDSLSIISIYSSQNEIGKFLYFFTNKIKLENNSCIYLSAKNSIKTEIINLTKQFCDKTFDFSKLYVNISEK